ncbi:hypothetical protein ONR57_06925 [Hoyosella sp. YIM 151337]|uniref:hypothetical protein n=1 Tax=Hoyosella sp. YIM 151337 TaxID=2992742 RepID=UPI0022369F94|nr:hypothetical protein [Hoyosella sp. YIM 151337]MCW4353026.1 hypothetical protein [Hoyosella sp. YIM 151337]
MPTISDAVRRMVSARYFSFQFTAEFHEASERFGCVMTSGGRVDILTRNLAATSTMRFLGAVAPDELIHGRVIVYGGRLFQRLDQPGADDWMEFADTGRGWLNELLPLCLLEVADPQSSLAPEGVTIIDVPVARIPDDIFSVINGEVSSAEAYFVNPIGTIHLEVSCTEGALAACDVSLPCTDGVADRVSLRLTPVPAFDVAPPAAIAHRFADIGDFAANVVEDPHTVGSTGLSRPADPT